MMGTHDARRRRRFGWIPATLALIVAGTCAAQGTDPATEAARWQDAQQMILVTTPDWTSIHGMLRTYERRDGQWHEIDAAAPVVIGREGAGWGLGLQDVRTDGPQAREGSMRSPAGVYRLGTAFGYAPTFDTAMPYAPMHASSYCVDVSDSPLYTQIVDANVVGEDAVRGASEHMRLDIHSHGAQGYKIGFVIEHNPKAVPGGGSCIFAHLWKTPDTPTAGCTAMTEATMRRLLAWLDPARKPVFVLLPHAEYEQLQAPWQLPAVEAKR
jgi:L,D-peptidoglycan transpeptidase YkuD (ErfK/YbiS/YcfS/YnhG family)